MGPLAIFDAGWVFERTARPGVESVLVVMSRFGPRSDAGAFF